MDGIFNLAMAIKWAGTDLSQEEKVIIASNGIDRAWISTMAAIMSREARE
jgi:hypothetical protein